MNYSITELEMTGLLVNMENWKFYLGKKDFDAAVDHRAIPYIVESKELPTTDRIIRLLQRMARFNFHLYYVKGKDMILCDFRSRIKSDNSDPHELIPIAFHYIGEHAESSGLQIIPVQYNPKQILDTFFRIQEVVGYAAMKTHNSQRINTYMVVTRGQAKAAGAVAPQVHGANKPLDPDKKPERDTKLQKPIIPANISTGSSVRPTAIPNKPMAPPPVQLPVKVTPPTPVTPQKVTTQNVFKTPQISQKHSTPQTIPGTSGSISRSSGMFRPRNVTPQLPNKVMRTPIPGSTTINIPQSIHSTPILSTKGYSSVRKQLNFDMPNLDTDTGEGGTHVPTPVQDTVYSQPKFTPQALPQAKPLQMKDLRGDPSLDPDRELPLQESAVEGMFRAPILEDFIVPPTSEEETRGKEILAKNLPKQNDIDKLMKVLNRKILTRSRFPDSLKDLETAYVQSAYFKDVYEYLRYNRLPTNVRKAYQVQVEANNYFLLGILIVQITSK